MTTPSWPERLYRIVRSNPPTEDDFVSNWVVRERDIAAGRRPRRVPTSGDALHMWSGISAFDTLAVAQEQARRYPVLGRFIAVIRVQQGQEIRVEKTGPAYHFTLWGMATALRATVERVESV